MSFWNRVPKFFRLLTRRQRKNLPYEVSIEITTRCNFNCKMCYRRILKVPEIDMPLELFKKIIKQMSEVREISLTGLGESLMHPEFLKMLDLTSQEIPKAKVNFTTNGSLMDKAVRQEILARPSSFITFSVDDTLQLNSSPTHLTSNKVLENIKMFCRGKPQNIKIRLQSILSNESQMDRVIAFAVEIGADIINWIRMDVPQNYDVKRIPEDKFKKLMFLAKTKTKKVGIKYACGNDHNLPILIASHFDRLCLKSDDFLYIDVNGNVLPCCFLRNVKIGNLKNETLSEIWRSRKFKDFIKAQPEICGGCDIWKKDYWH